MDFIHEIYRAFLRCKGYVVSTVGFFGSWALWAWTSDTQVPLKWLVPLLVAGIFLIAVLFETGRHSFYERKHLSPRILQARVAQAPYASALALLVLEHSPMFGNDGLVSIYQRDGSFELLVGVGFVSSVQQNGLIQVVVTHSVIENSMLWQNVTSNDSNTLKTLTIKPTLPKSYQPIASNV